MINLRSQLCLPLSCGAFQWQTIKIEVYRRNRSLPTKLTKHSSAQICETIVTNTSKRTPHYWRAFSKIFRICYDTYALDTAHYLTRSKLLDAYLRFCRTPIEHTPDRKHLELVESLICDGVSSIYDKCYSSAENQNFLQDDTPKEWVSYKLIDANNFHGGVMEKFLSAIKSFRKTHCTIQIIWTTADCSETSVVLKVVIYYPDGLHDQHRLSVGSHEKNVIRRFWKLATK